MGATRVSRAGRQRSHPAPRGFRSSGRGRTPPHPPPASHRPYPTPVRLKSDLLLRLAHNIRYCLMILFRCSPAVLANVCCVDCLSLIFMTPSAFINSSSLLTGTVVARVPTLLMTRSVPSTRQPSSARSSCSIIRAVYLRMFSIMIEMLVWFTVSVERIGAGT